MVVAPPDGWAAFSCSRSAAFQRDRAGLSLKPRFEKSRGPPGHRRLRNADSYFDDRSRWDRAAANPGGECSWGAQISGHLDTSARGGRPVPGGGTPRWCRTGTKGRSTRGRDPLPGGVRGRAPDPPERVPAAPDLPAQAGVDLRVARSLSTVGGRASSGGLVEQGALLRAPLRTTARERNRGERIFQAGLAILRSRSARSSTPISPAMRSESKWILRASRGRSGTRDYTRKHWTPLDPSRDGGNWSRRAWAARLLSTFSTPTLRPRQSLMAWALVGE